jgi:4-coumarate--CoA ligase
LIKFKGYQVTPAELEDLLLTHPAIEDAAVLGVMNPDLQSEVPLAYIRLKEGWNEDEGTAASILHHVKGRVVHYKHLRGGIVWTPSIPKSASGKILKRVLRDQAESSDRHKRIGAVDYGKYRSTKI